MMRDSKEMCQLLFLGPFEGSFITEEISMLQQQDSSGTGHQL